MKTLILYQTYSGGTQAASQIVSDTFQAKSLEHEYKTVTESGPEEVAACDMTVFCTPTWDFAGKEGQPHEDFLKFIDNAAKTDFAGKKFAVLGLGDSSYTHFCGSVDVLEQFVRERHGELLVPSLKIDGFFFNQDKHTQDIKTWAETLTDKLK